MTSCDGNEINRQRLRIVVICFVCIAHCMRKSTKCQNVTILVSSCGALYIGGKNSPAYDLHPSEPDVKEKLPGDEEKRSEEAPGEPPPAVRPEPAGQPREEPVNQPPNPPAGQPNAPATEPPEQPADPPQLPEQAADPPNPDEPNAQDPAAADQPNAEEPVAAEDQPQDQQTTR